MGNNINIDSKNSRDYRDYSIGYDSEAVEYDLQWMSRLMHGKKQLNTQLAQKIYYRIKNEDIHFKSETGEEFLVSLYENMTDTQVQEINNIIRRKRQKKLNRNRLLRMNSKIAIVTSVFVLISSAWCMINGSLRMEFEADNQTNKLQAKNQILEEQAEVTDTTRILIADASEETDDSTMLEEKSSSSEIVTSQIPMLEKEEEAVKKTDIPETETVKGNGIQDIEVVKEVDDKTVHTVTFSMNGGKFSGDYNNYSFKAQTPVLVIDNGDVISTFPDDKYASYTGYQTEKDTWYLDKECLNQYDKSSRVTESITLYKKWYNVTSDGSTPAAKGFYISPDGKILYKYDGDDEPVIIPQTVITIAEDAFDSHDNTGDVTLLAGID